MVTPDNVGIYKTERQRFYIAGEGLNTYSN